MSSSALCNTFVKMFWTSGWQVTLQVMINLLSRQNNFFVLPEFAEKGTRLNTCDCEMVLPFSEFPWMIQEELPDLFHSWKMLEMLVLHFCYRVNLNNWLNWVKNRFMTSVIFWTIHRLTHPVAWGNTGDLVPEGIYGLFWRTVGSSQILHLQKKQHSKLWIQGTQVA